MKQIILNGKKHKISAASERVVRIILRSKYAAKKSDFVEGRYVNYQTSLIPESPETLALLGVRIVPKQFAKTTIEKRFFRDNPRCTKGVFGNKRRIDTIVDKLNLMRDERRYRTLADELVRF